MLGEYNNYKYMDEVRLVNDWSQICYQVKNRKLAKIKGNNVVGKHLQVLAGSRFKKRIKYMNSQYPKKNK